ADVTAEDLVAALAAHDDLAMLGCQARDHVLRKGAGAGDRAVEVVDDLADVVDEILHGDVGDMEREVALLCDGLRVMALVVLGAERKLAVEAREARAASLRRQTSDDAGIEAAAEVRADRHIAALVDVHGVLQ